MSRNSFFKRAQKRARRFKKNYQQSLLKLKKENPLFLDIKKKYPKIDELMKNGKEFIPQFHEERFLNDFSQNVLEDTHWKDGEMYQKGIVSEYLVSLVLRKLKEEGVIKDFFQTKRYSSLDLRNVDFEIVLVNGKHFFFPLQVKSSRRYQKKHFQKNPDIASVVVRDFNLNGLYERIKRIIQFKIEKNEIIHI